MNKQDIENVLQTLSTRRPCFHNEQDFQFELAKEIQQHYPSAEIRLEKPMGTLKEYLDIYIELNGEKIGIELKYKTAYHKVTNRNEKFEFKNQGGHSDNRYYFVKDLERLEAFKLDKAFAIMLTNDRDYYNVNRTNTPNDLNFRIHETKTIKNGKVKWLNSNSIAASNHKNITLKSDYHCLWETYSTVTQNNTKKDEHIFKYLLIEVDK